jgi:hypothetical protein
MASEVDKFKQGFFDRGTVLAAMDEAAVRGMKRTGGYLRKVARNSMKKRAGASPPGQPPNVHVGTIKSLLFFAFDPATKTLVVGPVGFGGSDVPKVLEFSGRGIAKRPFMKPAQDASVDRLAPSIKFGS